MSIMFSLLLATFTKVQCQFSLCVRVAVFYVVYCHGWSQYCSFLCACSAKTLLLCITRLIGSGVVFLTEEKRKKRRRKYSNSGDSLIREPVPKGYNFKRFDLHRCAGDLCFWGDCQVRNLFQFSVATIGRALVIGQLCGIFSRDLVGGILPATQLLPPSSSVPDRLIRV